MNDSDPVSLENKKEAKLPRRDWILLPMISLLTIALLAGSTELIARRLFSESKTGMAKCMVLNDPATGARGIPNTSCWGKSAEGPWVEYSFNNSGYRAGMAFGAKQPGTYRIVMTGSSVAVGDLTQRDKTFAALLPTELTQLTGRKVQLYNEGMGWGFSHSVTLRFNDVLKEDPDLILWILTPMDVKRASLVLPTADLDPWSGLSPAEKVWKRLQADLKGGGLAVNASELFSRTRTALMVRHYLFENRSQYVKSYLASGDSGVGYLKQDLSPEWETHLRQFDSDAAVIEGRARAEGIPFVAAFIPDRVQAAMISMGQWPKGEDPYKLDNELRAIITCHGGIYLDIAPDFRNIPDPEQGYLTVDGHPNTEGHAIIAGLLARELTSGAIPELRVHPPAQQSTSEQRR